MVLGPAAAGVLLLLGTASAQDWCSGLCDGFNYPGILPPAPFASNATVSYNYEDPEYLASIQAESPGAFTRPARTPQVIRGSFGQVCSASPPVTAPAGLDDFTLVGKYDIPTVSDLFNMDTTSIFRIEYGLVVDISDLRFNTSYGDRIDAVNYIKEIMQVEHAAFLRVGLDLRIKHLMLVDGDAAALDPWDIGSAWDHLITTRVLPEMWGPVYIAQSGGQYGWASVCHLTGNISGIRSDMLWGRPPGWEWPSALMFGPVGVLFQEMGHGFPVVQHSQCYHDNPTDDRPLEKCLEIGCYDDSLPSWTGFECPPIGTTSAVGYCFGCSVNGQTDRIVRMGETGGPMWRIARFNILQIAALCLGPPVAHVDLLEIADADHDEIPDSQDNCPNNWNNQQVDYDLDGVGEYIFSGREIQRKACKGCAIGPGTAGGWWLILPALAVRLWRRR